MARDADAQPVSPSDLAPTNDLKGSIRQMPASNVREEPAEADIGDELHALPGSQDVKGIAGPSFRDNEFKASDTETPFQLPRVRRFTSHKAQRNDGSALSSYLAPSQVVTPSESGLSGVSFISFATVKDRGLNAHNRWEDSMQNGHNPSVHQSTLQAPGMHGRPDEDAEQAIEKADQLDAMESFGQPAATTTFPSDPIDVKSIADTICDSLMKSAFDDRDFLPFDKLREILSPHVVRKLLYKEFEADTAAKMEIEVLGACSSGAETSSARRPRRRRIFAILILVEDIKRFRDFVDQGYDDEDLPFRSNGKRLLPAQIFGRWPARLVSRFSIYQQVIHIPFLELQEPSFYDLSCESTLPFCSYKTYGSGGYGTVRSAEVHHAHHNDPNYKEMKPLRLAVKQLHVSNENEYAQEVDALERLSTKPASDPSHLIQLRLTYKHGRDYFLAFAWADGNLKDLWRGKMAEPRDPAQVCWFFNQCRGIAGGLRKIHHLCSTPTEHFGASNAVEAILSPGLGDKEWGRHGDIKPENILWFKDYDDQQDYLVICDFGLTQFNTAHSRSRVTPSQIQGYSGTYRPPDLHLHDPISQRYDVWSLGCVFLEFVSWFLLGEKGVNDFMQSRGKDRLEVQGQSEDKFFGLTEGTGREKGKISAELKDSVIAWIEKLRRSEHCIEPLRGLLDLIQSKMLVPNSRERRDCRFIHEELGRLCPDHNNQGSESALRVGTPSRLGAKPMIRSKSSDA